VLADVSFLKCKHSHCSILFPQPDLDFLLKQVWADNADYCSRQYAGTGALKTDFTRTGKRTKFGLLKDGYNSAVRYYKNNFADGFRQVSTDTTRLLKSYSRARRVLVAGEAIFW